MCRREDRIPHFIHERREERGSREAEHASSCFEEEGEEEDVEEEEDKCYAHERERLLGGRWIWRDRGGGSGRFLI